MGKNKDEKINYNTLPDGVVAKDKYNGKKIHEIKNKYVSNRITPSRYDLAYEKRTKRLFIVPHLKNARNCCLAIKNGKVADVLPRTAMKMSPNNEVIYANEFEVKDYILNMDDEKIEKI